MAALHKITVYKPLDIKNPFLEGQDRAYADILQDKFNEMKFWRKIIGISFVVLFSISLLLFWRAVSMQQVVPVLVNVMPTGEAVYLGAVRQAGSLQIPEAAIHFQIRSFITYFRSVSIDPQVLYNNIDTTFSMVTSNYAPIMTNWLRANSPFQLLGSIRRSVEIESIIRITQNSYQVDWFENTIEATGHSSTIRMRGIITISLFTPPPDVIRRNPLGIFIDNFEWTQL